ncbi:hypothetical protein [uncultured Methanobrevibacter sp.]|uniref:hypothetical protein n=1 Tax=uncultured Methanobrevibacter sp. TaxID=253161 RepID=UPI0025FFF288|nr:hypothetical protein [uncultured Methanobrevibacter sp.]
MNLVNIRDFDLRHNVCEIVLQMINATNSSYKQIIIFGDIFGEITVKNTDNLTFNKNTLSVVYECGDKFTVNHKDIVAFKVIR